MTMENGGNDPEFDSISTENLSNIGVPAGQFGDLQSALDYANANEIYRVLVNDESYGTTSLPDKTGLVGVNKSTCRIVADVSGPALDLKSNAARMSIKGFRVQNTGSGPAIKISGGGAGQVDITGCRILGEVVIDDDNCSVTGCNLEDSAVTLNGGNNVVVGNARVGSVTDNGTSNVVNNNS